MKSLWALCFSFLLLGCPPGESQEEPEEAQLEYENVAIPFDPDSPKESFRNECHSIKYFITIQGQTKVLELPGECEVDLIDKGDPEVEFQDLIENKINPSPEEFAI